jgi:hypothetical protein
MGEAPWHKTLEPVHHNNSKCKAGQDARGKYERSGTGGKPLCPECARLNAGGVEDSDASDRD